MWQPRRLTTLWASTASYGDSFTFYCYGYEGEPSSISDSNRYDVIGNSHLFIHSSVALQFFVEPWPLLQFRNLFYTGDRTPLTSDQLVESPLTTHSTTKHRINANTNIQAVEWDSNARFQRSSERRQFIP
jgi:hypothetical protein